MFQIGIVGAGIIGADHQKAILSHPECELAAVCDIAEEKAVLLANGTPARVYTDYRTMQEQEELDAVILNLPHFLHCEVSVFFLERGISVLVEKPMALNTAECDSMIVSAKKSGAKFAVGHVQRYFACHRKLKELISSGELGRFCSMTEIRNIDYFTNRPRWFLERAKSGGGIVMNYGAHTLDKLFYLTGLHVEQVAAFANNFLNNENVEASAQILLRLTGGATASFSYSSAPQAYQYETNFFFTNGAVRIVNCTEMYLSLNKSPFRKIEPEEVLSALAFQLDEFVKLLKGEPSEVVSPAYGREVITVLDEIFRQIEA